MAEYEPNEGNKSNVTSISGEHFSKDYSEFAARWHEIVSRGHSASNIQAANIHLYVVSSLLPAEQLVTYAGDDLVNLCQTDAPRAIRAMIVRDAEFVAKIDQDRARYFLDRLFSSITELRLQIESKADNPTWVEIFGGWLLGLNGNSRALLYDTIVARETTRLRMIVRRRILDAAGG